MLFQPLVPALDPPISKVAPEGSRLAPEGGCRTGILRDKKLTAIGRDPDNTCETLDPNQSRISTTTKSKRE
jgi:hypothetical protein